MYITYLFSLNKLFQCDDTKIFVHLKKEACIHLIKDQQFGCTIKFQRIITSIWAHLQVGLNLTTTKKIQNHLLMEFDFLITMEPNQSYV
jgi:hypothetical protein